MVFQDTAPQPPQPADRSTLKKLILVASIAAGLQFGWALQLLLLTPYTQLLGLNHRWASLIWMCGPISGLVIQPIVGHHSDRCTSRFGRRRPFVVAGTTLLSIGALLIAYAADIGHSVGDSLADEVKPRAIAVFIAGFWLFDIANNMIQGPCRALLADISGNSDSWITIGNALFSFFMAVGNIMGLAAGAYAYLYKIVSFTLTEACDVNCSNLKSCFILSVAITAAIIMLVVVFIKEERLDPSVLEYWSVGCEMVGDDNPPSFLKQIVTAAKSTPANIRILYSVTALNWIAVFPFLLYAADWMGREVYGGDTEATDPVGVGLYQEGVRAGAVGLMAYVMAMGAVSLFLEPLVRVLGNVRRVWSLGNFVLAACMGSTVVISLMAEHDRRAAAGMSVVRPSVGVKVYCAVLFTLLGLPQAVTYSIPFALASIYAKDTVPGQGLALGLLNLAIVIPQMLMTVISGPLDSLFGESNLPAFIWGGIAAAIAGIAALKLPKFE